MNTTWGPQNTSSPSVVFERNEPEWMRLPDDGTVGDVDAPAELGAGVDDGEGPDHDAIAEHQGWIVTGGRGMPEQARSEDAGPLDPEDRSGDDDAGGNVHHRPYAIRVRSIVGRGSPPRGASGTASPPRFHDRSAASSTRTTPSPNHPSHRHIWTPAAQARK